MNPSTEAGRELQECLKHGVKYETTGGLGTILAIEAQARADAEREIKRLRAALDAAYAERNLVVQAYAAEMEGLGWMVAWGLDAEEPDWPVLYIETSQGQVSWHIPVAERIYEPPIRTEHVGATVWDGHTTEEKHRRLRAALQEPTDDPR